MKKSIAIAMFAALALPSAAFGGSSTDRATGGGQILLGTDGKGAGDTIAFTAKGAGPTATGQIQYVDRNRTDENGDPIAQQSQHGEVTCLRVEGNQAWIEAAFRDGDDDNSDPDLKTLYIEDNGEGSKAPEPDVVVFVEYDPAADCNDDEPEAKDQLYLGRGNVQVYDASAQKRRSASKRMAAPSLSFQSALKIARFGL